MALHFHGKAIFSTHNGEYARRDKIPTVRTVLRSDPVEDQRTMVARLQRDFPDVCIAITAPITDTDVYDYFDYCDATVQGFEFLRAVLAYIAGLNAGGNAKRATEIQDYVDRWRSTNTEAFTYIRPYHGVTDLFTETDIEEHGAEFLTDAMIQIKHQRMQEDDDEAFQSAIRLQMQHAHIMHDQRSLAQSPAPARPPFPVNFSTTQGMRVTSNPEFSQPHAEGGPLRQLPGPLGQFPTPRGYSPLPRLTQSTEVLEHIHPGSTSRGDFHSDPTARNFTDTRNFGPLNDYVAIPSRGLPGPFNYRQLAPSIKPVPLVDRVRTFSGNLPKGKKNPKKKSSDDARMVFYTEHGPRHASNGVRPKPQFAPEKTQMSVARKLDAIPLIQESRPPGAIAYPGDCQQSILPSSRQPSDAQEPFHHPLYHRQAPMQAAMEGHPRIVSNPYPSTGKALQRPTQDPRPTVLPLPISTNEQQHGASAKGQMLEENAGSVSAQVPRHISQPLNPHIFGHQLPDRRTDAEDRQNLAPEYQRPALAPMPNAVEPGVPETPGRSRLNEVPRHPVQERCTIWIGGLPNDFDRAAVMVLLRPCQGLLGVSEPKVSSPTKNHINRLYAFADFENPVDAAEALERLPQTRFASLPEGTFLITNYPKPKLYPSPGRYQYDGDRNLMRPASIVSPTKSRKGEDFNRVGKSKNEHGRKPSKSSARGTKQSTGSAEGNTVRPSDRISAANAVRTESCPQPAKAAVTRDPSGEAELLGYVGQSTTEPGQSSKTSSQDPGVVQPGVNTETHADQVSRITGDETQDVSSSPSAKPQVQESHQATIPKRAEGRTKAPKTKSKGPNKSSALEKKRWEPPAVQPASEVAKPKAWAESSTNDASTILEDSGDLEDKGKQTESEIEASAMTAPTVAWEPTATLQKGLETTDQSFLGCNPTEGDGEQPEASVAKVTKPSSAKENLAQMSESAPAPVEPTLSAMRLETLKEPSSQEMIRHVSNSTQGSADTASSFISSTAPPSNSQTERSDSSTQETLSPTLRAARPLEAAMLPVFVEPGQLRNKLDTNIMSSNASPSERGKRTNRVQEELQNPTDREFGDFQPGLFDEDSEQITSMLTRPSPFKSSGLDSKSPARRRAPSVPPRSSSLAAPSTPIKTHRKKKPRNLTPVKEAIPSRVTGLSVEGTKVDSTLQPTGSLKVRFPSLTIDPEALIRTTDKSMDLPKPETPFLMDDGVRVTPPKISRQSVEASNADRYYVQKKGYQILHLGEAIPINAIFNHRGSSDSASTHFSNNTSANNQNDLETTLREAGFRSLSSTSPFTIRDPELALLETLVRGENPLENRTNKDRPVLSWVDDKGKLGPGMSWDAWTKQHEMIEVVKKATAVKRLLADPSPLPWTKIESLRQRLSRFVTRFSTDVQAQQDTRTKAQQIVKAKAVLNTFPERDSSTSEMQKWSRNASLFLEEHALEPSPARIRKPTIDSHGKSSRTPSRSQQREHLRPVLINQPGPQHFDRKFGRDEDAFRTAETDLNVILTSGHITESEASPSTFGSRTPPEERPTPSTALMSSAALNQVSKLKDLFVGMEKDHRRWSGDGYRENTPSEEERMTASNPDLKPLGGEFNMRKVAKELDLEPQQVIKEAENEVQQETHRDQQGECNGRALEREHRKQDRRTATESYKTKDPASTESKEKAPGKPENPTLHTQTSQLLGLSSSLFDSYPTTGNEGTSEQAQHSRPRAGHSPLKRNGYSAVAGRGTDGKRGRKKEASKDPWALPQGEKPWGSSGNGRGEKKKRGRQ